MLKVHVISRGLIKPSTPTPPHLSCYKLTSIDRFFPQVYVPFIFFYANEEASIASADAKIRKLKQSLSETLSHYYPLAGRIQADETRVECNDEGVELCEALVEGRLSEFLQKPYVEVLDRMVPCTWFSPRSGIKGTIAMQVTVFDCGGMAVGVCLHHKVLDGVSLAKFMQAWANTSHGGREVERPIFQASEIFPTEGFVLSFDMKPKDNIVLRRFVFDASKIEALRATTSNESAARRPSRYATVSAFILQCVMRVRREQTGGKGVCLVSQAVDLRRRMSPPLPETVFGNVTTLVFATATEEDCQHDMRGCLEGKLTDAISGVDDNCIKQLQQPDGVARLIQSMASELGKDTCSAADIISISSWCRFPFYEVDFGWGKPAWVSTCGTSGANLVILVDASKGGGIEAWVSMEDLHMAKLEEDKELLPFLTSA